MLSADQVEAGVDNPQDSDGFVTVARKPRIVSAQPDDPPKPTHLEKVVALRVKRARKTELPLPEAKWVKELSPPAADTESHTLCPTRPFLSHEALLSLNAASQRVGVADQMGAVLRAETFDPESIPVYEPYTAPASPAAQYYVNIRSDVGPLGIYTPPKEYGEERFASKRLQMKYRKDFPAVGSDAWKADMLRIARKATRQGPRGARARQIFELAMRSLSNANRMTVAKIKERQVRVAAIVSARMIQRRQARRVVQVDPEKEEDKRAVYKLRTIRLEKAVTQAKLKLAQMKCVALALRSDESLPEVTKWLKRTAIATTAKARWEGEVKALLSKYHFWERVAGMAEHTLKELERYKGDDAAERHAHAMQQLAEFKYYGKNLAGCRQYLLEEELMLEASEDARRRIAAREMGVRYGEAWYSSGIRAVEQAEANLKAHIANGNRYVVTAGPVYAPVTRRVEADADSQLALSGSQAALPPLAPFVVARSGVWPAAGWQNVPHQYRLRTDEPVLMLCTYTSSVTPSSTVQQIAEFLLGGPGGSWPSTASAVPGGFISFMTPTQPDVLTEVVTEPSADPYLVALAVTVDLNPIWLTVDLLPLGPSASAPQAVTIQGAIGPVDVRNEPAGMLRVGVVGVVGTASSYLTSGVTVYPGPTDFPVAVKTTSPLLTAVVTMPEVAARIVNDSVPITVQNDIAVAFPPHLGTVDVGTVRHLAPVTVSSMPELDIASQPPVVISELPKVRSVVLAQPPLQVASVQRCVIEGPVAVDVPDGVAVSIPDGVAVNCTSAGQQAGRDYPLWTSPYSAVPPAPRLVGIEPNPGPQGRVRDLAAVLNNDVLPQYHPSLVTTGTEEVGVVSWSDPGVSDLVYYAAPFSMGAPATVTAVSDALNDGATSTAAAQAGAANPNLMPGYYALVPARGSAGAGGAVTYMGDLTATVSDGYAIQFSSPSNPGGPLANWPYTALSVGASAPTTAIVPTTIGWTSYLPLGRATPLVVRIDESWSNAVPAVETRLLEPSTSSRSVRVRAMFRCTEGPEPTSRLDSTVFADLVLGNTPTGLACAVSRTVARAEWYRPGNRAGMVAQTPDEIVDVTVDIASGDTLYLRVGQTDVWPWSTAGLTRPSPFHKGWLQFDVSVSADVIDTAPSGESLASNVAIVSWPQQEAPVWVSSYDPGMAAISAPPPTTAGAAAAAAAHNASMHALNGNIMPVLQLAEDCSLYHVNDSVAVVLRNGRSCLAFVRNYFTSLVASSHLAPALADASAMDSLAPLPGLAGLAGDGGSADWEVSSVTTEQAVQALTDSRLAGGDRPARSRPSRVGAEGAPPSSGAPAPAAAPVAPKHSVEPVARRLITRLLGKVSGQPQYHLLMHWLWDHRPTCRRLLAALLRYVKKMAPEVSDALSRSGGADRLDAAEDAGALASLMAGLWLGHLLPFETWFLHTRGCSMSMFHNAIPTDEASESLMRAWRELDRASSVSRSATKADETAIPLPSDGDETAAAAAAAGHNRAMHALVGNGPTAAEAAAHNRLMHALNGNTAAGDSGALAALSASNESRPAIYSAEVFAKGTKLQDALTAAVKPEKGSQMNLRKRVLNAQNAFGAMGVDRRSQATGTSFALSVAPFSALGVPGPTAYTAPAASNLWPIADTTGVAPGAPAPQLTAGIVPAIVPRRVVGAGYGVSPTALAQSMTTYLGVYTNQSYRVGILSAWNNFFANDMLDYARSIGQLTVYNPEELALRIHLFVEQFSATAPGGMLYGDVSLTTFGSVFGANLVRVGQRFTPTRDSWPVPFQHGYLSRANAPLPVAPLVVTSPCGLDTVVSFHIGSAAAYAYANSNVRADNSDSVVLFLPATLMSCLGVSPTGALRGTALVLAMAFAPFPLLPVGVEAYRADGTRLLLNNLAEHVRLGGVRSIAVVVPMATGVRSLPIGGQVDANRCPMYPMMAGDVTIAAGYRAVDSRVEGVPGNPPTPWGPLGAGANIEMSYQFITNEYSLTAILASFHAGSSPYALNDVVIARNSLARLLPFLDCMGFMAEQHAAASVLFQPLRTQQAAAYNVTERASPVFFDGSYVLQGPSAALMDPAQWRVVNPRYQYYASDPTTTAAMIAGMLAPSASSTTTKWQGVAGVGAIGVPEICDTSFQYYPLLSYPLVHALAAAHQLVAIRMGVPGSEWAGAVLGGLVSNDPVTANHLRNMDARYMTSGVEGVTSSAAQMVLRSAFAYASRGYALSQDLVGRDVFSRRYIAYEDLANFVFSNSAYIPGVLTNADMMNVLKESVLCLSPVPPYTPTAKFTLMRFSQDALQAWTLSTPTGVVNPGLYSPLMPKDLIVATSSPALLNSGVWWDDVTVTNLQLWAKTVLYNGGNPLPAGRAQPIVAYLGDTGAPLAGFAGMTLFGGGVTIIENAQTAVDEANALWPRRVGTSYVVYATPSAGLTVPTYTQQIVAYTQSQPILMPTVVYTPTAVQPTQIFGLGAQFEDSLNFVTTVPAITSAPNLQPTPAIGMPQTGAPPAAKGTQMDAVQSGAQAEAAGAGNDSSTSTASAQPTASGIPK